MKKLLILLILLFSFDGLAKRFLVVKYTTIEGDSLSKIYARFVRPGAIIYGTSDMVKLTRKNNPHIADWEKLVPKSQFKLVIEEDMADEDKIITYNQIQNSKRQDEEQLLEAERQKTFEAEQLALEEEQKKKKAERARLAAIQKKEEDERAAIMAKRRRDDSEKLAFTASYGGAKNKASTTWQLSGFYTISRGSFAENIPSSGVKAETQQNSPFTLGLATSYISSLPVFWSGSIYLSQLNGVTSNLGDKVKVPWEYGLNLYGNYPIIQGKFATYAGIDYERFSTFNVDELDIGEPLSTREHTLTFATVGASLLFPIYDQKFFFKGSFSKSVQTTTSRPSLMSDLEFEGYKFIVYLNTKVNKKVLLHFLYKHHILDGPTKLDVSRYGIGFGYIFF